MHFALLQVYIDRCVIVWYYLQDCCGSTSISPGFIGVAQWNQVPGTSTSGTQEHSGTPIKGGEIVQVIDDGPQFRAHGHGSLWIALALYISV